MVRAKQVADQEYSEDGFWDKVKTYGKKAGREVVEKALWLFYAAKAPATPKWAKTAIYGALAYFIFPLDAIPDFAPLVGYTDDLGVLVAALGTVASYITDDIKQKASKQLTDWFGE
ncbi:MAG TPA: YkvA family protein [Telluria sp.]|nr:YkvA family protein [Telluria sp.]